MPGKVTGRKQLFNPLRWIVTIASQCGAENVFDFLPGGVEPVFQCDDGTIAGHLGACGIGAGKERLVVAKYVPRTPTIAASSSLPVWEMIKLYIGWQQAHLEKACWEHPHKLPKRPFFFFFFFF